MLRFTENDAKKKEAEDRSPPAIHTGLQPNLLVRALAMIPVSRRKVSNINSPNRAVIYLVVHWVSIPK